MNAFELKEILSEYTDEELQAMHIRVLSSMEIDLESGELFNVEDAEVNQFNQLILDI